ncbi:hypothetical protein [Paraburkholderia lacunae]|uniref:hypothetical protein n=1 Tax=Paraburkholderia lacunae TaxID=2211104 RepID=UPI00140244D4|nr:hypothetical protein [Paraburkholderia lacunae]
MLIVMNPRPFMSGSRAVLMPQHAPQQPAWSRENRTFLMSQNQTLLKSSDTLCQSHPEMSQWQLFRNVGF